MSGARDRGGAATTLLRGLLIVVLAGLAQGCAAASPRADGPAATPPTATVARGTAAPAAAAAVASNPPASTVPSGPLDPPVSVRVGLLSSVSDAGVYIGFERGYYRELGLDLQLETITDPNVISTQVGAGQLDVGGFGVNANPFGMAARGIGLRMVADKGSLRRGFGYVTLLARQDLVDSGQLRSLADLRGRTIGRLAPCDSADPWFERAFQLGGLARSDVEFTQVPFPEANLALANRAVDLARQTEPLLTVARERGIATPLVEAGEIYPDQQVAALFYSPDFAGRTEAARRFTVAYVRALRDYNDAFGKGRGRAEIADILARNTTVKDLALYEKMTPAGLNPDGQLNVAGIRDDLVVFRRLGCVTSELADVDQVVDESFVRYAVGVLGPYQP
jgi:NitT/TauT family transport system substrate-binding protein